MQLTHSKIRELKLLYGKNKIIPFKYEEPILTALAAFPELKDVHIEFRLVKKHPVPYATTPSRTSIFLPASKRKYTVILLERAKGAELLALFRNLPFEGKVAVIGHELVHVVQFHRCSIPQLIKMMMLYPFPSFKKSIERGADIGAIRHGFGHKLHQHALYLRSIPGYINKRPELNKYYLKPGEILLQIKALQSQSMK